jgi:hypothetical protein
MTINGRKEQSHGKAGRQTPTQILYRDTYSIPSIADIKVKGQ